MSYNTSIKKYSAHELALQMYAFLEDQSNLMTNLQPSDIDSGIKTQQIDSIFNNTFTKFENATNNVKNEKVFLFIEFSHNFNLPPEVNQYILNYFKQVIPYYLSKLRHSLDHHVLNLTIAIKKNNSNVIPGFGYSTNWTTPTLPYGNSTTTKFGLGWG